LQQTATDSFHILPNSIRHNHHPFWRYMTCVKKKSAEVLNLGTTLTNQNDIHDEIRITLNSGNACCHSVRNLLS
jgi:hypothetical protein